MKRILILAAALFTVCTAFAQSEYNLQRRSLFEVLPVYSSDIVFLGNSITDGCEWAELFNNRHVKNRGISGDRSGWLLDRLDPIVGGHPKKLFLMIGVNDLAAGVSPDEIVANVARLIDRFQSESRWTKIYVQSILPVNGESFAKFRNHYEHGRQIVPLNKRLEALCDCLHGDFCRRAEGTESAVLFESTMRGGMMFGFTGNYIHVKAPYERAFINRICRVRLGTMDGTHDLAGEIVRDNGETERL